MARFPYLSSAVETLKAWSVSLRDLTFHENFRSYEWTGEIEAGQEKGISHRLKVIPTRFIITSARYTNQIVLGDTPPNSTHFYVKNVASTSTFVGKILILP